MKKYDSYHTNRFQTAQSGMTLIEVLISMFVLAVGVLALLAVQLRSVSSVREAESQTIVSQISQNLIEGMLINPTLSQEKDASGNPVTPSWPVKSYDRYYVKSTGAACPSQYKATMNKQELADAQICEYRNTLAAALPETTVHFAICNDSTDDLPNITNGVFNANCDNKGSVAMIKAAWLQDLDKNADNSEGSLKTSDNKVVYTYQARIAD